MAVKLAASHGRSWAATQQRGRMASCHGVHLHTRLCVYIYMCVCVYNENYDVIYDHRFMYDNIIVMVVILISIIIIIIIIIITTIISSIIIIIYIIYGCV